MQYFFLTLIMASLSFFKTDHTPKDSFKPVVVLELFTSQGCSSCPPADQLLKEVKQTYSETDVVTLSYHVDYWDYIGWKDPFAKQLFTKKQRIYGSKFYSSSIYTPQVVINGKEHFVGSQRNTMKTKLEAYLSKQSANTIAISKPKVYNGKVNFDYAIEGNTVNKSIRVALVVNDRETYVKRGENRSRTLNNSNIVVSELEFDIEKTFGEGQIVIPNLVKDTDELRLVLIVQNNNLDITGASQINL